jgi:hypothetical protein
MLLLLHDEDLTIPNFSPTKPGTINLALEDCKDSEPVIPELDELPIQPTPAPEVQEPVEDDVVPSSSIEASTSIDKQMDQSLILQNVSHTPLKQSPENTSISIQFQTPHESAELVDTQSFQIDRVEEVQVTPNTSKIAMANRDGDVLEISIDEKQAEQEQASISQIKSPSTPTTNLEETSENEADIPLSSSEYTVPPSPPSPSSPPRSPMARFLQPALPDPPTPTVEDITATITISSLAQLEDDKAILRSFLDRAAASKGVKATMKVDDSTCGRRESVQNRRDSDTVRQALASPRLPLEDKDNNTFSPANRLNKTAPLSPVLKPMNDEVQNADLIIPPIDDLLKQSKPRSPRRSRRSKGSNKSSNSAGDLQKITLRRTDGNETINLTKSEAQLLALETRRNTKKNKGTALSVQDRVVKYQVDLAVLGKDGQSPGSQTGKEGKKSLRWSETLSFLNEETGESESAPILDNAQLPSKPVNVILLPAPPPRDDGSNTNLRPRKAPNPQTPRRRVRALRSSMGTPAAKELLAAAVMPDEVTETLDLAKAMEEPPSLTHAAISGTIISKPPPKSRLQPPTKLNLNPSVKSIAPTTISTNKDATKKSGIPRKPTSLLPVAGKTSIKK